MSRLLLGTLGPLAVFCGAAFGLLFRIFPPAHSLYWGGAAGLAAAGCIAVGLTWSCRAALWTLVCCLGFALALGLVPAA